MPSVWSSPTYIFRNSHGNNQTDLDSVLGIATRYWTDIPGSEARLSAPVQACRGAHPAT
jgi:hypothetical protein